MKVFVRLKQINNTILIFCILAFTVFHFSPLYFTNHDAKITYYLIIVLLFSITLGISAFFKVLPQNKNKILELIRAVVVALGSLLIGCFFVVLPSMLVMRTVTSVYYENKTNPSLRIVSCYNDVGGLDGGGKPNDYAIVLRRSITSYLALETKVDTNSLDKNEWIKK